MLKQAVTFVKGSPFALHLGLVILQIAFLGIWYVKDVVNLDPYPIHTQGTELTNRPDPELAALTFVYMIRFLCVPALFMATLLTYIYVCRSKSKASLSSLPVVGFHVLSYGLVFSLLGLLCVT